MNVFHIVTFIMVILILFEVLILREEIDDRLEVLESRIGLKPFGEKCK